MDSVWIGIKSGLSRIEWRAARVAAATASVVYIFLLRHVNI